MKFGALIGTLALGLMSSSAFAQSSEAEYIVSSKDTLYSISRQTCINLSQLLAVNGIENPDGIRPGSTLKLPSGHCYSSPVKQSNDEEKVQYELELFDAPRKPSFPATSNSSEDKGDSNHSREVFYNSEGKINANRASQKIEGLQATETILVSSGTYTVLLKDTLYSITRRTCSDYKEILRVNNIVNANALQPGMELYLPVENCIASGTAYKPVKSELDLTVEQKQAKFERERERIARENDPNYVFTGGIESFSNPHCSRNNAQALDENGDNFDECEERATREARERAAKEQAARDAKGPHIEAPSGFAAFLANKDVQDALISGGNQYYETKTDDARIRQKIAKEKIQRQRDREFQLEQNRQLQIRQAERSQMQNRIKQETADSSARMQRSIDNGEVASTQNPYLDYKSETRSNGALDGVPADTHENSSSIGGIPHAASQQNSNTSSDGTTIETGLKDYGCYQVARTCISIDIEKTNSKTTLWVKNHCGTRMYKTTCLYDSSGKDWCEADWLPASSRKQHYSYNEDMTNRYKVEVVGSKKGMNDWVCSSKEELVETFRN